MTEFKIKLIGCPQNPQTLAVAAARGCFKESREIVHLIISLIKNINNSKLKNQIKKRVKEIAKKFPIYQNFRW